MFKMDQSYSDSELSMSPSQLLERLQVLRQLQLIQRGKLQQQQSLYQNSPEIPNITEIVSHFSNSTSYNTFRSLLHTHQDSSNEVSPIVSSKNTSRKLIERDFIDGVSALNLSQESEFLLNSPNSMKSKVFSDTEPIATDSLSNLSTEKSLCSKQISLDEMPILNPEKNFETLIAEKIQSEDKNINNKNKGNNLVINVKKSFLKKGEGMSRFGLQKKDLIIQHTNTLPWHRNKKATKSINKQYKKKLMPKSKPYLENIEIPNHQIKVTQSCTKNDINVNTNIEVMEAPIKSQDAYVKKSLCEKNNNGNLKVHKEQQSKSVINLPAGKHPLQAKEGKTWAAVLTNEQDDFLRKLKQSDYYKNFCSPTKSAVSEISCDESMIKVYQDKEIVEQKMFELLEHKVAHESFNDGNSFINRFLHKHKLECSGESTPLIMQQCLSKNPNLIHINPNIIVNENENVEDNETCESDCTEGAETCSSISSCSCVTVEPASTNCTCYAVTKMKSNSQINKATSNERKKDKAQMVTDVKSKSDKQCLNGNINNDNDIMKANMAEMNAKLIATSELLKERLSELEDEIETFKKENANLAKSREEIDLERQKFYEEKATYEQKFNEEKILSEYYIAEEKEKLTKQRQLYERYVKDMRGQINKKDKNEVIQLKKEINDLKEDIRIKDAKTTSTIARLRNQIKIMEKEKKTLQDEIEKLKKENRRIQHSNDVTRRLTNLKYLEQINKKLANITTKDSQPDVYLDTNIKYKAFEIERQSRNKKIPDTGGGLRHRAKSVPNLNVTSRYAKYFSQKDYLSEVERNKTFNDALHVSPIDDNISNQGDADNLEESKESLDNIADSNEDNNLEKMYKERFQSPSPKSKVFTLSNSNDHCNINDNHSSYFKSKTSSRHNQSSTYQSNLTNNDDSAINVSYKSSRKFAKNYSRSSHDSEDLTLFYSKDSAQSYENNSLNSKKSPTSNMMTSVINNEQYQDSRMILTPEPSTSKSSLTKTNLNPTEIKKPDGSRELRFPNGNVKLISADGKYSKFLYYNGDIKENFYNEGRIKYFYAETKTFHTTHADGLEVLEFSDGQVEKRYKDGSSEIRLPNGSVRYFDPKNDHVREEWRFPDGATLTVAVNGEQRIVFSNGQVEVHADDHKRREFPDGTVKLVYNDGTAETRYASGRVRIKDKHGNLIMDSAAS